MSLEAPKLETAINVSKGLHLLEAKERVHLSFSNITYSVDEKVDKAWRNKDILKGISGVCRPGELVAVIGSSGAGKTTLLDLLAGRKDEGEHVRMGGNILVNGTPITTQFLRNHSAYIQQEDVVMETLTVRECITFSAKLRLPSSLSDAEIERRVDDIIAELGLGKCQNTLVGNNTIIRGVSGGERKRTNIGIELITDPSLLFVDEPTSGLDAFRARKIINILKRMCEKGRTVICTIHQPSSDIFSLFDRVLLMVDGQPVYHGTREEAFERFGELGYPCPQYSNPADHFMYVMEENLVGNADALSKFTSVQKDKTQELLESEKEGEIPPPFPEESKVDQVSFLRQTALLSKRTFLNYTRNPMTSKARLAQMIFLGLFVGLLYLDIGHDATSIQDRTGALFFVTVSQTMTSILSVVITFPSERALFIREASSNTYSPSAYFTSKFVSELPFQFIFPFVFSIIAYFMIGFQSSALRFFAFYATTVLCVNAGQSIGILLSSAAPTAEMAISGAPIAIIPFMLFAGLFVNVDSIPPYFWPLMYLSPFKYGFELLLINEYTDLELDGGVTGESVLEQLNVEKDWVVRNILALFALWGGIRFIAFFALKSHLKRG